MTTSSDHFIGLLLHLILTTRLIFSQTLLFRLWLRVGRFAVVVCDRRLAWNVAWVSPVPSIPQYPHAYLLFHIGNGTDSNSKSS